MSGPPGGTVTFLFTDIEGSTRLLRRLGDGYAEVLARHDRVISAACADNDGHEIDSQGDAHFLAFARAHDAVAAAAQVQRGLAAEAWPAGSDLRVRVGLHTGDAATADGRYVGLSIHRAARICAAAHGGQVLLSSATVRSSRTTSRTGSRSAISADRGSRTSTAPSVSSSSSAPASAATSPG